MDRSNKPFRVLAIDGGGMRGLYSATVLDELAKYFAQQRGVELLDIGKGFDLITGTSVGGILACGLAFGMTSAAIIDFFRRIGPKLFQRPIPSSWWQFLIWAVRNPHRCAHKDQNLSDFLYLQFGNTTLIDVYQKRGIALCIPSVDMSTGRSYVFKTPHSPELVRDRRFKLADVCLSTSAAPIYLPIAVVDDPNDPDHHCFFADGGLWANNPVLVGLIEALGLAKPSQPIQVLSLSACPASQGEVPVKRTRHWGLMQWRAGTKALSMALESQSWGYEFMASKLAIALKASGRDCSVIRLPHVAPSAQQSPFLGLDRASQRSLQILTDLGKRDGDMEESRMTELRPLLTEIFSDMPETARQTVPDID